MSGVLLWTDIETTGLDECRDAVLEIGMQATDWDLHPLDRGMRVVVRSSRWWWRRLRVSAYCRHMHTVNRLIDEVDAGGAHTFSRSEAGSAVVEYSAKHSEGGVPLLAGSSVDFDRRFLKRMHFLGHSALEGVSHRIVDVSVLDEIARHRYPDVYAHRPDRTTDHRVANCLHDSMNLFHYYQQHLFKTEGKDQREPTYAEIDAAAHVLCERWDPGEWGKGFETADDDYRQDAKAMLIAARKAVSVDE